MYIALVFENGASANKKENHQGLLVFVVGKLFYNLFLHPLRKYPGPFWAGSTRVYYLFYDVRGQSHWKVTEWHKKYGPVVRIAPNELSYTDSRAWSAIYGETQVLRNPVEPGRQLTIPST